ncbi:MAG: hypothetical protein ACYTFG_13770 [Planctomycetota bacterium]|jgi:hypothetical protein
MIRIIVRFIPAMAVAFLLLAGCEEKESPEPGPEGTEKSQAVTDTDLEPKYPVDGTWSLELKANRVRTMGTFTMTQAFALSMKGRIAESKDGVPIRLEYTDVKGPQTVTATGREEEETVNRGGSITGSLDSNLCLLDARDKGHLSDDILMAFPAGPICGFVPPGKKVRPGDTWSSGDVLPVGPKTLRKKDLVFSAAEGECTLEKIEEGKAHVKWTGSAKVSSKGKESESAAWTVLTLFDLQRSQPDTIDTTLDIRFPEGIRFKTTVKTRTILD